MARRAKGRDPLILEGGVAIPPIASFPDYAEALAKRDELATILAERIEAREALYRFELKRRKASKVAAGAAELLGDPIPEVCPDLADLDLAVAVARSALDTQERRLLAIIGTHTTEECAKLRAEKLRLAIQFYAGLRAAREACDGVRQLFDSVTRLGYQPGVTSSLAFPTHPCGGVQDIIRRYQPDKVEREASHRFRVPIGPGQNGRARK